MSEIDTSMAAMLIESVPWCKHYNQAINYTLVAMIKPKCEEDNNGCYGCEHQYQKEIISTRSEQ